MKNYAKKLREINNTLAARKNEKPWYCNNTISIAKREISLIRLASSSGNDSLDQAALLAVQNRSVGKPPAGFVNL
ncbi:hypothetical protein J4727_11330 [Providencia rettgeri]|uniref:Uncharacterized protein n=1 Tax=Providencia rettgeri TaxID=587 RepID=A0A939SRE3_PRORE|nr:hypothetical protein [Providencia rettgeri]